MASLTPDQAASAAKSAADAASAAASAAQEAAAAAQIYADQAASGLGNVAGAAAHAVSGGAIDPFIFQLSVFVLAIFVGYYVVWQVTPALHTPLMSVTNAISSVIVVGALLAVGVDAAVDAAAASGHAWAQGFGFVALILASVNIFGGFLVTSRMLAMYKKKTK
ncbi:proton-translocating transhydrogenase family protein [Kaistia defluvii]|uniref:proton-translocating transhydrogenase family protein n=1 Tax=Kaistia defluvii TaxID=410841 RepID=UPI002256078C|nr:proton-translocating transhydrogenase family protein [Kaistia defluvii]MCX5517551.1 proton-translocating transhydrogenase family protein [Kaistia defluvii]